MIADPALLGVGFAVLGALAWSSHYLFIRVGMDGGELMDIVLVSLLCNLVLIVPVALIWHYPDLGLTPLSIALFGSAGLGSGLFARILQYKSTRAIGASRTSPIAASAGLFSTLLAVTILGETLTTPHLIGILLIVGGVAVTSWETANDPDHGRSFRAVAPTLVLPLSAAVIYGIEPILLKMGLETGTPYLVGMAIMIVTSTVAFVGYRRLQGPIALQTVARDRNAKWYLGAGLAGTIAFFSYFSAINIAPVVIVIPIFQTTPLLVAGLSFALLPRRLELVTWRLVVAAGVVVVGASLVSLSA